MTKPAKQTNQTFDKFDILIMAIILFSLSIMWLIGYLMPMAQSIIAIAVLVCNFWLQAFLVIGLVLFYGETLATKFDMLFDKNRTAK